MKYRKFGETGFEVSALGFGCMRLPTVEGGGVDEPLAVEMIRRAIDAGVNYLDTAYVYHGGNSERVIAKALRDGYREKVWIADKMPIWSVKEHADLDRLFAEQLDRLEVKKIDVFLLHNIQAPSWARMRDLGSVEWLAKQRADGKVGCIGFSYHDDYDTLAEILEYHDRWDMVQIQYNYMNEEVQSGTKGLEHAASKGVAVAVMEPLLGGCLAKVPAGVQEVFDSAGVKRTPVDWALRWLWNK
ncbi:MAG: aldo/keto reductase, partial [Planctomycetota bacterium]